MGLCELCVYIYTLRCKSYGGVCVSYLMVQAALHSSVAATGRVRSGAITICRLLITTATTTTNCTRSFCIPFFSREQSSGRRLATRMQSHGLSAIHCLSACVCFNLYLLSPAAIILLYCLSFSSFSSSAFFHDTHFFCRVEAVAAADT